MAERKSAEIKFRCTPSFKSAVQAQAEADGIPASQLIENAVESRFALRLVEHTTFLDADVEFISTNVGGSESLPTTLESEPDAEAATDGCACRPWEYCTHKASA